eukprot:scaffold2992_cov214-Amphora_coffeaeformis.AAC.20
MPGRKKRNFRCFAANSPVRFTFLFIALRGCRGVPNSVSSVSTFAGQHGVDLFHFSDVNGVRVVITTNKILTALAAKRHTHTRNIMIIATIISSHHGDGNDYYGTATHWSS